jgi:hypothetical protein
MWCGPLSNQKMSNFHFDLSLKLSQGVVHDFSGEVQKFSGEGQNNLSWGAHLPSNPVRKHTNYHTLECIHREIKKVKFEPRTTISELFLINKWPGNKLNFEIIKRGCVAGMQNMLSKPWAATVLGLVSVNDGPFGIAIQLFQLRLSTSNAEKSNTSGKGCLDSTKFKL